jgi:hypothetical protein
MTVIKKTFKSIVAWVKDTPAIQPLLIIAIIFVAILGLTQISPLINTVQGWFGPSTAVAKRITIDKVETMFADLGPESSEDFIFIYSNTSCGYCQSFKEKKLSPYLKTKDHVKAYVMEIDIEKDEKRVEAINDDSRVYDLLSSFTKSAKSGDGGWTNYYTVSYDTPVIVYVKDGVIFRVRQGDFASYVDFKDFMTQDTYTPRDMPEPNYAPEGEGAWISKQTESLSY